MMKKLFSLLVLTLCLMINSTAMAGVQKLNPEDFLGTWYFTASEVEGDRTTAVEMNRTWRLHFYEQNGELFVSYMDDFWGEPYETQITLEAVEREEPSGVYAGNFRYGSYYKMLRQYKNPKHVSHIDEYLVYLPDKDFLVLKMFYKMDGAPATSEAEFSRIDPFEEN